MKRALLLILCIALTACGYQSGNISGGAGRTIAVPIFSNGTYRRDLERDLTRVLLDEIHSRTALTVVDESSGSDLVVRGKIVDVSEGVRSERSRGRIRESSVIVTVVVTIDDLRAGKPVIEKRKFIERQPFVPVKGETLRTAEVAALRGIAERIVYNLSMDW